MKKKTKAILSIILRVINTLLKHLVTKRHSDLSSCHSKLDSESEEIPKEEQS